MKSLRHHGLFEDVASKRISVRYWNDWRDKNSDEKIDLSESEFTFIRYCLYEMNLRKVNFEKSNLYGAFFGRADLSEANLKRANLEKVNFVDANLSGANLSRANLRHANFHNANLSRTNFTEADFTGLDLSNLELSKTTLKGANFTEANLTQLNFSGLNLSGTNFSATQILGTIFNGAILTGACIENWNINSETKLDNVTCDYVFLKQNNQERRPSDPNRNFEPGEFAKLVQKSVETVDLIFNNGIDWRAFLSSYQDIQIEYGEQNISIQAIEKKSDGAFVIRLNVPAEANKAEIESKAKQSYETKLAVLEAQYREKLKAKDEQITIYRQHNTDLLDIIKLKAAQPISENHFHGSVGSVDNKGTQSNIAGEVEGSQNS